MGTLADVESTKVFCAIHSTGFYLFAPVHVFAERCVNYSTRVVLLLVFIAIAVSIILLYFSHRVAVWTGH